MNIILDTDMGNDIDDALALVMLHALERLGECRLLGVAVSKGNDWAAEYTRLVNASCGRVELPVALVESGVTPEDGAFIRAVCERLRQCPEPAEDAVTLVRRLLAGQPDRSVVLLSIGFYTNLARLLDSPADCISPLDGRELVDRKVHSIVSMAGDFSAMQPDSASLPSDNPEFNVRMDIASARHFIARCPRPIIFSGFEIGGSVLFPGAVMEGVLQHCAEDPVALGYMLYLPMPYDRPVWDQTAVLQAVRPDAGYFDLSAPGLVEIDERGYSTFVCLENGPHRHLILRDEQRGRVAQDIINLCLNV